MKKSEIMDVKTAAQYALECFPKLKIEGFTAYAILQDETKIPLGDPLEIVNAQGVLEGMAAGRVLVGNNTIPGGFNTVIQGLKKSCDEKKMIEDGASKLSKEQIEEIHSIAEKVYKGIEISGSFGLSANQIPLSPSRTQAPGFGTRFS